MFWSMQNKIHCIVYFCAIVQKKEEVKILMCNHFFLQLEELFLSLSLKEVRWKDTGKDEELDHNGFHLVKAVQRKIFWWM